MSRPVEFTKSEIEAATKVIGESKACDSLLEALCIKITAVTGATIDQVGEILGVSRVTVSRMRKRFRSSAQPDSCPPKKQGRGGRRRQVLSPDEEVDFLAPWMETAKTGGVIVVPPVHRALEERVGRKVATATTYNLLARHGWRKVEPDTRHPKANENAQEAFKKTSRPSLPKRASWRPQKE